MQQTLDLYEFPEYSFKSIQKDSYLYFSEGETILELRRLSCIQRLLNSNADDIVCTQDEDQLLDPSKIRESTLVEEKDTYRTNLQLYRIDNLYFVKENLQGIQEVYYYFSCHADLEKYFDYLNNCIT